MEAWAVQADVVAATSAEAMGVAKEVAAELVMGMEAEGRVEVAEAVATSVKVVG